MQDAEFFLEPEPVREGPMVGWCTWMYGCDPYETLVGPFYLREDPGADTRCAVLAEQRHANGAGALHGGFLTTFADYALFAIARRELPLPAVTLTLNCEFLSAARPGALLEATGQVLRSTRSLVFVRGIVFQHRTEVMSFSGVIKKLGPAALPQRN